MYKIDQTPYVLQIAKQDEYGLTHEFDISDWLAEYPDLTVGIAVVRPEETEDDAEPATTVIDGTTMTWTIRPWETEKPGHGTAEARMLSLDINGNPVKVKSAIIRTFVVPSIADGLPTDPQMSYIDQVIVYANVANEKYNLAIDEANRAHEERVLAEEENRLAGVARDEAEGFAGDAQTAQGLAESAAESALEALQSKNTADTLRDEALLFRNDAQEFSQAAKDSEQIAAQKADLAEAAQIGAEGAANEAGRYYASLIGVELEVDVVNGTLNLYSAGDYSPIDIELNDRLLEVWGA